LLNGGEDLKETEDFSTIRKVLEGNVNAFEILVDKYSKRVYGYIFKSVRDKYVAEELTQEIFLKIYRSLNRFDMDKSFSVWLFTIAKNTMLDYFKQSPRQYTSGLNEEVDFNKISDDSQNPLYIVEKNEKRQEIDRIIDTLPDKYRELIVLKYFEELNYSEISRRLDISINKVKWRLYEARKQLVRALRNSDGKERGCNTYGM